MKMNPHETDAHFIFIQIVCVLMLVSVHVYFNSMIDLKIYTIKEKKKKTLKNNSIYCRSEKFNDVS